MQGFGIARSKPSAGYSGRFVPNAAGAYDYATLATIPDGFGDGEFCLELDVTPTASGVTVAGTTIATGSTASVKTGRWSSDNSTIYGAADWWFLGNFLLDGHNNTSPSAGTFSVQLTNSGRVQWTFGDGAAADARTGDLHGLRGTTDIRGSRTKIYLVRRWDGGTGSILELWVNGTMEDSEISTARTNMATTYWDGGFPGFTVNQRLWMFGAEKQAAIGVISEWEDAFLLAHAVNFYNSAPTSGNLTAMTLGTPDEGYDFSEGIGSSVAASNGGASMSVTSPAGTFWVPN